MTAPITDADLRAIREAEDPLAYLDRHRTLALIARLDAAEVALGHLLPFSVAKYHEVLALAVSYYGKPDAALTQEPQP